MPRGGKRPGAGAPKGNLNHLKHGERSKQVAAAIANALRNGDGRETVMYLVRKYG